MTYYDEIADGYDELHRDEQIEKYDALVALQLITADDRVLDLGHGSGLIAERIDAHIIGIDASARLLERSPCETIVHDFSELPLPFDDASFDWVVSFTAIHHAPDPEALVAEALRIARKGVALSLLRDLPSFEKLSKLFAAWDPYPAGRDTLYVRTL